MYDNAYVYRHTNAVSRINSINQLVTQKFATTYGLVLSFTAPTLFSSHGDSCEAGYSNACDCCTYNLCTNWHRTPSESDDTPLHHKNAYNILHTTEYYSNIKQLTFIGHNVCYWGFFDHEVDTESSHTLYGMASVEKNLAQVHDHTNSSSITHEACTTFHEVGHLFGAPDHYQPGRTTSDMNELIPGGYFSINCIYGDNKESPTVISNMTVCEGCRKLATGELTYS